MRHEPTDAECKLWSILRSRRLAGFKFRRQVPIAGYIVDFYCVRERVVIELDGGQHLENHAIQYDEKRTQKLNALGIRVLRFSDYDMLKDPDAVADSIYNSLVDARPSPQPSPRVPGEGVNAGGARS